MPHPDMLFSRINVDLVNTALIPALEKAAVDLCRDPQASESQKLNTIYLLNRLRTTMKQPLPGVFIRPPRTCALDHAEAVARVIKEHGMLSPFELQKKVDERKAAKWREYADPVAAMHGYEQQELKTRTLPVKQRWIDGAWTKTDLALAEGA